MAPPTFERVVQLLNDAVLSQDSKLKVTNLLQVQELVIHKESSLLDNFFEEVIGFQNDPHAEVRKTVLGFIEEACKHDPELLSKSLDRLAYLVDDESATVLKRMVSCMITLYRLALTRAAKTKGLNVDLLNTFKMVVSFKDKLLKLLYGPNEGVRMHVIKLMEAIIIMQTRRHPESEIPKARENDISVDQIPDDINSQTLKLRRLEDEAVRLFDELIKYLNREQISSINVQTLMSALTSIARQRPQFIRSAVQGLETIHVNLPTNLKESQVSSVRKALKNNLLLILKHPASYEFQSQITTLLTDLGATQSEVVKAMPKIDEMARKRKLEAAAAAQAAAVAASAASAAAAAAAVHVGGVDDGADSTGVSAAKRARMLSTEELEAAYPPTTPSDATPFISLNDTVSGGRVVPAGMGSRLTTDVDKMTQDLIPKLTTANVTDLVLLSMVMLPDSMPPAFQATYTPIAAAGTEAQIKHLARLLSAQLMAAGLAGAALIPALLGGGGAHEAAGLAAQEEEEEEEERRRAEEMFIPPSPMHISTLVSSSYGAQQGQSSPQSGVVDSEGFKIPLPVAGPSPGSLRRPAPPGLLRPFTLESVTQMLPKEMLRDFCQQAYTRILVMPDISRSSGSTSSVSAGEGTSGQQQQQSGSGGPTTAWAVARATLLIALSPAVFGGADLYGLLWEYCMQDLKQRYDLLARLVLQEYCRYKGYQMRSASSVIDMETKSQPMEEEEDNASMAMTGRAGSASAAAGKTNSGGGASCGSLATLSDYDAVLTGILSRLASPGIKETYFARLMMEAPLLTARSLTVLKYYCMTGSLAQFGFKLLHDLILRRPAQREDLMSMLLDFTMFDHQEIREPAIAAAKSIREMSLSYRGRIEKFARENLKKLVRPRPTADVFPFGGTAVVPAEWSDEVCRPCLYLFLALMQDNHLLLRKLTKVYIGAAGSVKRAILHVLDVPIKRMGMESTDLLQLIETCPKGTETLVLRIIHILTDRATPTPVLVEKVKELYTQRVSDVRFLVPVLKGLSKQEVIAALPKVVPLSDKVVKEAFRRLLTQSPVGEHQSISPEDLLIAVHLLEFAKDESGRPSIDLPLIVRASQFCFGEPGVYTQERLSIVIGQLLDQPVLPTLFMRTVIQSLRLYPALSAYVVNVLVRVIKKQVWKNPHLWEGFLRCCLKTAPRSYQVLLQLPPDKLEAVFEKEPHLRDSLHRYVENLSAAQRVHITKAVITVLERSTAPIPQTSPIQDQSTHPHPLQEGDVIGGSATSLLSPTPTSSEMGVMESISVVGSVQQSKTSAASGNIVLVTKSSATGGGTNQTVTSPGATAPIGRPVNSTKLAADKERQEAEKRKYRDKQVKAKQMIEQSKLSFFPPTRTPQPAAVQASVTVGEEEPPGQTESGLPS